MSDETSASEGETKRFTVYEEKLDELHDGLRTSYAAGYAKALEDFDVDDHPWTNTDQLRESEYISECHYYFWDGRTLPLEFWLRDTCLTDDAETPEADEEDSDSR